MMTRPALPLLRLFLLLAAALIFTLILGCGQDSPSETSGFSLLEAGESFNTTADLASRHQVDSAAVIFQGTMSKFDRCKSVTALDSIWIHCMSGWYFIQIFDFAEAGRQSDLAYDQMLRHPEIPDSLRNDILLLRATHFSYDGRRDSANTMLTQLLKTTLSQNPFDSESVFSVLLQLASNQYDVNDNDSAVAFYSRVIAMGSSRPVSATWAVSNAVSSVCGIYEEQGEYVKTESLLVDYLHNCERLYGPNHPITAEALHSLAELFPYVGRQYEGIELSRRAIAILEAAPDSSKTELPYYYHTTGNTYRALGLYDLAEKCAFREASLDSLVYGPTSVYMCYSLMSLGDLRRMQCRFDEAEALYRESLSRAVADWGPNDPRIGDIYWSLAYLFLATGRTQEVDRMLDSVTAIQTRTGGVLDVRVAARHRDRARSAALQGRFAEAISQIHESESLVRKQRVPSYFLLHSVLKTGAEVFCAAHEYDTALTYFDRMLAIERQFIEQSFPYLTESQRLQWLNATPPIQSGLISLAMWSTRPRYLSSAFGMTLNAKGRALDAAMAERQFALCPAGRQAKPILDEYLNISGQLANLVYLQMTQSAPNIQVAKLAALTEKRDSLELSLSHACFESDSPVRHKEIVDSQVFGQLSHGAVLWDFVRYCPADKVVPVFYGSCPCDDHYAVFVCDASGVKQLYDIGRTSEIDSLVLALRSTVADGADFVYSPLAPSHEAEVRRMAGQLTRRLPPLPPHDSATPGTLFVSPDGLLGLLPFELLTPDSSGYLIDNFRIIYLASSRDLVNDLPAPSDHGQAIILAAPAYDSAGEPFPTLVAGLDSASQHLPVSDALAACFGSGFVPLPQSATEAQSVANMLQHKGMQTVVKTGRQATESFVRSLAGGPSILHFATHGFFCTHVDSTDLAVLSSPLLRSGLALTGANLTLRGAVESTDDDGILTAYEVSAMDLSNTELVVLSACETGTGDVSRSDGLIGLTRAFRQAGARSVIMNIWDVPDDVARDVTTEFYRRWVTGTDKVDALREASLAAKDRLKKRFGHTDPFLWCGFVLVGDSK